MDKTKISRIKLLPCSLMENKRKDRVFTGLYGRYTCMSIDEDLKAITLFDSEDYFKIKVGKSDLPVIKSWACRDKGSLYIRLSVAGNGLIYNKEIRSD
jgi:hypothetical protein